jgi:hypothetical protein
MWMIVPLVMIFFFVRNAVMVETDSMDSWMGGGMRMFGKVDKMLYRVSGMKVIYQGKEYFVNFRNVPLLENEDVTARILPNNERLNKILHKVKAMEWCFDSTNNNIVVADKDCTFPIAPEDIVKVEVYRTDFNDSNNEVSLQLINSFGHGK